MKIALQTYSIRDHMSKDAIKTVQEAMNIGYKYFEVANHSNGVAYNCNDIGIGFGIGPDAINELMAENHAHVLGVHILPFPYDDEKKLSALFEYHHKIGTRHITVPLHFYNGRDEVIAEAERLNKVGKLVTENGFVLTYHNHYHEYQKFNGETVMNMLLENTDPNYVKLEFDTVWAMCGGCDPIEFIKKHGDRIALLHQKDFNKDYANQMNFLSYYKDDVGNIDFDGLFAPMPDQKVFVEIGTGFVDIQGIIDAANQYSKAEYLILEQDYTQLDEIDSIRESYKVLSTLKNIEIS